MRLKDTRYVWFVRNEANFIARIVSMSRWLHEQGLKESSEVLKHAANLSRANLKELAKTMAKGAK
jgi:hypothetical protein